MRETHRIAGPVEVPGKARPRVTKRGTAYMPRPYIESRNAIRALAVAEMAGAEPASGPVSVSVLIRRGAPKSLKRAETDIHRPDLDNCAGTVLDALNGVAWLDDSQIVRLVAEKLPRVPGKGPLMVVTWASM